jgi:LmbE family N-acetylglucosaminyl deacetylase
VKLLDYMDGDLDQADPERIIQEIVAEIRRIKPDVVVTFDPSGVYGHPDHIAISQFTAAAVVSAADAGYQSNGYVDSHRVPKLYYMIEAQELLKAYEDVFGELVMNIDGVERRAMIWPEWSANAHVDTGDYYQTVWEAVRHHRSQLPGYEKLLKLPDTVQKQIFDTQYYYRVFSLVNGGRKVESDLFEGIQ